MTDKELVDDLVKKIEPLLKKYKKSLLEPIWKQTVGSVDFRNFASHDIANVAISIIAEEIKNMELPDNVCENDDGRDFTTGYQLAQQDMLKAILALLGTHSGKDIAEEV